MKPRHKHIVPFFQFPTLLLLTFPMFVFAQTSANVQTGQGLPRAPVPQTPPAQNMPNPPANPQLSSVPQTTGTPGSLTLKQAEELAIKNNPQISVGRLIALASQQFTREVKSSLWPTATADITGVDAQSGSRI